MNNDKVALVTGGSQGIGLAIVAALAGRGYRVVALARNLDRLKASIAGLGETERGLVTPLAADVSQEADVASAVDQVDAAIRPSGRAGQQCGCQHELEQAPC